ncbi:hypothetical protein [Streptomyces sp. NPDC005485]|uniref:hypothetical protein n=1 Tax=Streptomyces sp. NPDC005485 TaxID=3155591 RepID=UPI0033B6D697
MPADNGPYLIDRVDGGLHQIGVVSAVAGEWEADYRAGYVGCRCAPQWTIHTMRYAE